MHHACQVRKATSRGIKFVIADNPADLETSAGWNIAHHKAVIKVLCSPQFLFKIQCTWKPNLQGRGSQWKELQNIGGLILRF